MILPHKPPLHVTCLTCGHQWDVAAYSSSYICPSCGRDALPDLRAVWRAAEITKRVSGHYEDDGEQK